MFHFESRGSCLSAHTRTILALLIAIATLTLLTACGKEEAKPQARPPAAVSVVKIEPRDTPVVFEYVAQTQSSHQVEIRARVSGFLDRRLYTEGAVVKEGQVLFLMDKKPFQAQVDSAAAALARKKAAFETARLNPERIKPLGALNAVSKKNAELIYVETQGTVFQTLVNVYKSMSEGWVTEADRVTAAIPQASALPSDAQ